MARQRRLIDKRLLGTWRFDTRKTFLHFKPKPGATPAALRRLKSIFGKLTLTWSRREVHSDFDGVEETAPYEVLAMDSTSVVIRTFNRLFDEEELLHIHFDDNRYWVAVNFGTIIEWFRKVDEAT